MEEGEGEGEETENLFSDQLNPVTLDRGRGKGGSGAKAGKERANVQKGGREQERARTHALTWRARRQAQGTPITATYFAQSLNKYIRGLPYFLST